MCSANTEAHSCSHILIEPVSSHSSVSQDHATKPQHNTPQSTFMGSRACDAAATSLLLLIQFTHMPGGEPCMQLAGTLYMNWKTLLKTKCYKQHSKHTLRTIGTAWWYNTAGTNKVRDKGPT